MLGASARPERDGARQARKIFQQKNTFEHPRLWRGGGVSSSSRFFFQIACFSRRYYTLFLTFSQTLL